MSIDAAIAMISGTALGWARTRAGRTACAVAALTLLLLLAVAAVGLDEIRDGLTAMQAEVRAAPLLAGAVLFAWSFVLFLTVLPLGTATILLAGALMGPWAGFVQFLALIAASQVLFEAGGGEPSRAAAAGLSARPRLSRLIAETRRRGIAATMLLRVAPMVPSAVCALACRGFSVARADFIAGTLLAGWIRPVFFAYAGAAGAAIGAGAL